MLDYILTVHVNGELKTLRPTDFNTAQQAVLLKFIHVALDRQSGKPAKKKGDQGYYWSTATNAPPGVEG